MLVAPAFLERPLLRHPPSQRSGGEPKYDLATGLESLLMRSSFSPEVPVAPEARVNVKSLVKDTVIDALSLEPADFDWQRSLAELGCDSLNVIDIQFDLEKKLGVRISGWRGR